MVYKSAIQESALGASERRFLADLWLVDRAPGCHRNEWGNCVDSYGPTYFYLQVYKSTRKMVWDAEKRVSVLGDFVDLFSVPALPGRMVPASGMYGPITPRAPENSLGAYQGPSSHRTHDPLAENRRPGMSALPRHQSGCEAVPAGYRPGTGHSGGTEPSVVRVHHRYRARPRPPLQDRLITGGGGKKITRTVT